MSHHELLDKIKDSYSGYYAGVDGPIGGGERFRWVFEQFARSWRGTCILEIGCGEGSLLQMLASLNEVHGVDISKSGVERTLAKGIPCRLLDASNEKLPYDDGTFDVVITLETIEHVENPHRMLWEIQRVLKNSGQLLISVPGEGVCHPFIYPGLFTRKNFTNFLEMNGFEPLKAQGWGQAPMMARWVQAAREKKNTAVRKLAALIYYIGRKRNSLIRNWFPTPLSIAYTVNYLCSSNKTSLSRAEKLGKLTTPFTGADGLH